MVIASLKELWACISASKRFGGYFAVMALVFVLALVGAMLYAIDSNGLHGEPAKQLADGWTYLQDDEPRPLGTLPVTLGTPEESIILRHALTSEMEDSDDVLAFHASYAAIRVWADDTLVYTSPEGEEHVPTSVWHFIPMEKCRGAETITIELTHYFSNGSFQLDAPYLDTTSAIQHTLIEQNSLVITFCAICILLTFGLFICGAVLYRWRSGAHQQLLMGAGNFCRVVRSMGAFGCKDPEYFRRQSCADIFPQLRSLSAVASAVFALHPLRCQRRPAHSHSTDLGCARKRRALYADLPERDRDHWRHSFQHSRADYPVNARCDLDFSA